MKIFISYRRKDSTEHIGRIKDRLTAEFGEGSVFRDLDDIRGGEDFRTSLEKATNECNVMLVMIGPQWASIEDENGKKRLFEEADFTRIEVEAGLKRLAENKVMVIPVLLMNASMPKEHEIPPSLRQLHYQNAISIRNDPDFNNDMKRLIDDISRRDTSTLDFEPETIYIAEGTFIMGSSAGEGIPSYETPQHEIFLPAYRIGTYPVTNSQYHKFITEENVKALPRGWSGQSYVDGREDHPVTGVTWYQALEYCKWLSRKTGRKYSLPSEAQWERACRGGKETLYPWGDEFDSERCNHKREEVAAVDAYPAQNDFGLFDFVGNIRQWTSTLWGEKRVAPDPKYAYPWTENTGLWTEKKLKDLEKKLRDLNELSANRQIRRVVRGCSIKDDPSLLRCSARSRQFPDGMGLLEAHHGFRVARE